MAGKLSSENLDILPDPNLRPEHDALSGRTPEKKHQSQSFALMFLYL
jgi:hypothetical protein